MNRAEATSSDLLLLMILDDLIDMGVGCEEVSIDGAEAVDYLNELKQSIMLFLKEKAR